MVVRRPTDSGAVSDRTDGAAQLVLAGGEEERVGGHLAAVVESQAAPFQRPRGPAAQHRRAGFLRHAQQGRVEAAAGEAGGRGRAARSPRSFAPRPAAAGGSASRRGSPDRGPACSAGRSRPSRGSRRRPGRARRGCARSAPASRRPAPARWRRTRRPARRRRSAQPFDAQPEGEAADDPRAR